MGHSRVNSEVSEKCFYSKVLSSVPQSLIDLFAARISLVIISQNQAFSKQSRLCGILYWCKKMLKVKTWRVLCVGEVTLSAVSGGSFFSAPISLPDVLILLKTNQNRIWSCTVLFLLFKCTSLHVNSYSWYQSTL